MTTFSAKPAEVQHSWFIIDADNQTLGRLSSKVASYLRGKHKPIYTPHVDTGDYVVVINAEKIRVTGKKTQDKLYHRHSGFPGGLKSVTFEKQMAKKPTAAIEIAIKGMLPKNPLGRQMLRKLKVYTGVDHPHTAQQPVVLTLDK